MTFLPEDRMLLFTDGRKRADPAGATDFEVARPDANGPVFDASAFGVLPESPDNTEPLNRALAACRERGASRLVFGCGIYRFEGGSGILLDGLSDFVFDGAGAKFVFHRESGVDFTARDCVRLEMRDFSVDWDWERDPLASLVEVADASDRHVDFRFVHYRRFPRRDVRIAYTSPWDGAARAPGVAWKSNGRGFDMSWGTAPRPHIRKEWLSGNLLRVHAAPDPEFGCGDLYRIQHYYYDLGGLTFENCEDVFLENVGVESCPGFAFHIAGGRRFHMNGVAVRPPTDDERRVISCTADHLHVQRSRGSFKLTGCEMACGGDDCANFHDTTAFALPGSGAGTLLVRGSAAGFADGVGAFPLRAGDTLAFHESDFAETGFEERVSEVRSAPGRPGFAEIVFDGPVPAPQGEGFVLSNRRFDTRNVILRDCVFRDNRARGVIVQCPDVTIERCRFHHHECEALKITTGWTRDLWCEGTGVSNMVVRDCAFESPNAAGSALRPSQAIFAGTYMEVPSYERLNMSPVPLLRDILFERNVFKDIPGSDLLVGSSANIRFRGNSFYDGGPGGDIAPREMCWLSPQERGEHALHAAMWDN